MRGPELPGDARLPPLIRALLRSEPFCRAGESLRLIETHISWVILTGELAYKIKKPVNLGFVDFSTLQKRRLACDEELRLNLRLAPDVYLDVVAIAGSPERPMLASHGPPIEYAVRMRQFPPGAVLGEQPAASISPAEIEQLATDVARFHQQLPAATDQPWGSSESVRAPIEQSLEQLAASGIASDCEELLAGIRAGCGARLESCRSLMKYRRAQGCVRECHGDLHLGNIVRLGGRLLPFDALEFDPALRWIDVLNEVAFLMMDLEVHDRRDLAFRFLNRYLSITGDYEGLPVLPLYLAYRALVRAKVRILGPGATSTGERRMAARLLSYAVNPLAGRRPLMVMTCGVSGSGKTVLARELADCLGAVHLRSDVERKRLAGLPELARTDAATGEGIYAPRMSERTYQRLGALGRSVLSAGLPVIVDATHLRRDDRKALVALAHAHGCAAAILYCTAPLSELTRRVTQRQAGGQDASEAGPEVQQLQLTRLEAPSEAEADAVVFIDTGAAVDIKDIHDRIARVAAR